MENEQIAIIGLSFRFPQSSTKEEFWKNLCQGKELITFFSKEELIQEGLDPELVNHPDYVMAKGMLKNVAYFDAAFFGYSSREASFIDPQQRIMLECAWESLEIAGYDPDSYAGLIGVYASCSFSSYFCYNLFPHLMHSSLSQDESFIVMGTEKDFLPTRISYKLNLKGPSKCIQTACSSSLVAVHDACQALLNYECDIALAGGISITFPQKSGYVYSKEGINSPDGHCRAFDRHAAGTLIGNGGGIVVLKRYEEAIADGDSIICIIKGSSVNNDGARKVGYMAPSIEGQAQVILAAQLSANILPETISYVEAHGTGTLLGDPVEVAALTKAFRTQTKAKHFCGIGSVKTNIGHLDAAAGIAGMIKTILSLENQLIPPSLHYQSSNESISFQDSPFYVIDKLHTWKKKDYPLRAGVSSFGIGGTNAHVILEKAETLPFTPSQYDCFLFLFSAKTSLALKRLLENFLLSFPSNSHSLSNIAYTLQVGRKHFDHRVFFIASTKKELSNLLDNFIANVPSQIINENHVNRRFWKTIGERWLCKENIQWNHFYRDEKRYRVPLTTYPFERLKHWIAPFKPYQLKNKENEKTNSSFNLVDKLSSFWQESLKIHQINLNDDFFALGGDSLIALEILDRMRKELGSDISLKEFFEYRTLQQLTNLIEKKLLDKISDLSEEETLVLLKKMDDQGD